MTRRSQIIAAVSLIFIAACSRLIPHAPNFTPLAAMALFGGAIFPSVRSAVLVVFGSMLLSDFVIGFDVESPLVYLSLFGIVGIGTLLRNHQDLISIPLASLAGSILFFVVTNFGTWLVSGMYPHTFSGLVSCYTLAIPFFQNTLVGDLVYSGILFGAMYAAQASLRSDQTVVRQALIKG